MKHVTKSGATVDVEIIALPFSEHFRVAYANDPSTCRLIDYMVSNYGIWGWCNIEVKATFPGLSASRRLDKLSFKSEQDFMESCPYYEQMLEQCLEELDEKIQRTFEAWVQFSQYLEQQQSTIFNCTFKRS